MKAIKYVSSLSLIATNFALRCDAKLADPEYLALEKKIRSKPFVELGSFLPNLIAKGAQPDYLDYPTEDSVPVVNTLSIRNLVINEALCRHISATDFENLPKNKILRKKDVLLTVDGGVSIGKPALFDQGNSFSADSHIWILRPAGIQPLNLVSLLSGYKLNRFNWLQISPKLLSQSIS